MLAQEDRTSSVNEPVKKSDELVDLSFSVEQRKLNKVSAMKNKLSEKSLISLQADKSGPFVGMLPVGAFNEREHWL